MCKMCWFVSTHFSVAELYSACWLKKEETNPPFVRSGSFCLSAKELKFNICYQLLQARNSYSNEVVAIKKMSYNGKQTTEVRLPHTQNHADMPNFAFKTKVPSVIASSLFGGCVSEPYVMLEVTFNLSCFGTNLVTVKAKITLCHSLWYSSKAPPASETVRCLICGGYYPKGTRALRGK